MITYTCLNELRIWAKMTAKKIIREAMKAYYNVQTLSSTANQLCLSNEVMVLSISIGISNRIDLSHNDVKYGFEVLHEI